MEYELTKAVRDGLKAIRSSEANEDMKMYSISWVQLIVSIHNSQFLILFLYHIAKRCGIYILLLILPSISLFLVLIIIQVTALLVVIFSPLLEYFLSYISLLLI